MTAGSTLWVWRNPAQSSAWIARVAALLLALPCLANVLLIKTASDKDYFAWTISAAALVAGVLLLFRAIYGRQTAIAGYGALLATGMWASSFMEINLSGMAVGFILRNGGFYFGYALISGLFYLVERIGYHLYAAHVAEVGQASD